MIGTPPEDISTGLKMDEPALTPAEQRSLLQHGLMHRGHRTSRWDGEIDALPPLGMWNDECNSAEIHIKTLSFDFHCPCGALVRENFAHTSLAPVTVREMRDHIIPRLARFLDEHVAEEAARMRRRA